MEPRVRVRFTIKRDCKSSAHVYEETEKAKKIKAKKVQHESIEDIDFEIPIEKQKGSKLRDLNRSNLYKDMDSEK